MRRARSRSRGKTALLTRRSSTNRLDALTKHFFHTVIGNSVLRNNVSRSLTYDDWWEGGVHPTTLSETHVRAFEAHDEVTMHDAFGPRELLFARKLPDSSPPAEGSGEIAAHPLRPASAKSTQAAYALRPEAKVQPK